MRKSKLQNDELDNLIQDGLKGTKWKKERDLGSISITAEKSFDDLLQKKKINGKREDKVGEILQRQNFQDLKSVHRKHDQKIWDQI